MKKNTLISALALALICSLTACSRSDTTETPQASTQPAAEAQPAINTPYTEAVIDDAAGNAKLLNGKTVAGLFRLIPEADMEKTYEDIYKEFDPNFDVKVVYVDSLTDGLLMLRSRKADVLEVMSYSGTYLGQRNKDLKVYRYDGWIATTHMLVSTQKQAQFDKINGAIKAMKADGTLDKLISQWITNLPEGEEPGGGAMPVIEGAETLQVGISGDAPPLDYIAADGTPGGYNVAVLSEISRRANINIALVTVNSGARFTALQSHRIDAFLWHNSTSKTVRKTMTPPTTIKIGTYDVLLTDSYLEASSSKIFLK